MFPRRRAQYRAAGNTTIDCEGDAIRGCPTVRKRWTWPYSLVEFLLYPAFLIRLDFNWAWSIFQNNSPPGPAVWAKQPYPSHSYDGYRSSFTETPCSERPEVISCCISNLRTSKCSRLC